MGGWDGWRAPGSAALGSMAVLALLAQAWAGPAVAQQPQLDSTRNNYVFPAGTETVPLGTLGKVERHGRGPVPMILVPGHGFGGDVFRSFMEANEERYTMYAVTLPGFGGTAPPPLPPESSSYMDQIWTRGAEEAVIRLIEREGLDRPVVVGHFITGGQIAMRLALDHPDRVRGAVVLAGEARRAMGSDDPAVRRRAVDENLRKRWFKWVTPEVWVANNWKAPIMARDPELAETLKDEGNSPPVRVLIQYLAEFFASDVPAELDRLQRPLLALTPGFDADLLADQDLAYAKPIFIDSWAGMDAHDAVTVRSIEGARAFLWEDEPDATYGAIHSFVERLEGS